MPRSLRARLLLAVGFVVVLSVAAVGLLSRFGTHREIERFLDVETVRQEGEVAALEEVLARIGQEIS